MNSKHQGSIQHIWKGKIPYGESLTLQDSLKEQACKSPRAFIMGFECPACITLGLRGEPGKDLKPIALKQGVEVKAVKRGGQATLHSPGQLVVYPIMDLLQWKIRPRDFLSLLEQITCDVLKEYGITANKQESSAGLFTTKGKIAFFGIHISKGVSQHGLSLNVSNDLKLFNVIRSCGLSHRSHDSFQSYGLKPDLQKVFSLWCKKAKHFFFLK